MDRIQAMEVSTRVVDANSFTQAAETLGMPRASVTTIVYPHNRHLSAKVRAFAEWIGELFDSMPALEDEPRTKTPAASKDERAAIR